MKGTDKEAFLNGRMNEATFHRLAQQLFLGRSRHVLSGAWLGVFEALRQKAQYHFDYETFGRFSFYNVATWSTPGFHVAYPLIEPNGTPATCPGRPNGRAYGLLQL